MLFGLVRRNFSGFKSMQIKKQTFSVHSDIMDSIDAFAFTFFFQDCSISVVNMGAFARFATM